MVLRASRLARKSDPVTSHLAAEEMVESGAVDHQQARVLVALKSFDGSTSDELAERSRLDRYLVARRLPELERAGKIRRGEPRRSSKSKRMALTWWLA